MVGARIRSVRQALGRVAPRCAATELGIFQYRRRTPMALPAVSMHASSRKRHVPKSRITPHMMNEGKHGNALASRTVWSNTSALAKGGGETGAAAAAAAAATADAAVGGEDVESSFQDYYEQKASVTFHTEVWGESIHLGRYDLLSSEDAKLGTKERMDRAGDLASEVLLEKAFADGHRTPSECTIMDMGSSRGVLARKAVQTYGCKVICIDLSREFNRINADRSAAAGLSDKIIIPGDRSFFDTQVADESIDTVVSQDSFLHCSTEHERAIKEAARVLKPGGRMVFTDLMRSDAADAVDAAELAEVYKQQRIVGLASPGSYRTWGEKYGLDFIDFDDQTPNCVVQFENLLEVMRSARESMDDVDDKFFEWMTHRYGAWIPAAESRVLTCGCLVFRKKTAANPEAK